MDAGDDCLPFLMSQFLQGCEEGEGSTAVQPRGGLLGLGKGWEVCRMDGCAAGTGLTSGYEIDHFREQRRMNRAQNKPAILYNQQTSPNGANKQKRAHIEEKYEGICKQFTGNIGSLLLPS